MPIGDTMLCAGENLCFFILWAIKKTIGQIFQLFFFIQEYNVLKGSMQKIKLIKDFHKS